MKKRITKKLLREFVTLFDAEIFDFGNLIDCHNLSCDDVIVLGYNSGVMGWNFDAFELIDANHKSYIVVSGYRGTFGKPVWRSVANPSHNINTAKEVLEVINNFKNL